MERKGAVLPKPNSLRHADNLQHLHGYFYKGTYYEYGVGNPNKSTKIGGITEIKFGGGKH